MGVPVLPYDFMYISVSLCNECPMQSHCELDPKVASKGVSQFSNTIIPLIRGHVKCFRKPIRINELACVFPGTCPIRMTVFLGNTYIDHTLTTAWGTPWYPGICYINQWLMRFHGLLLSRTDPSIRLFTHTRAITYINQWLTVVADLISRIVYTHTAPSLNW